VRRADTSSSRPAAKRKRRVRAADTKPVTAGEGRSAKSRRVRAVTETDSASSSFVYRYRVGNVVIFLALIVAAAQLFNLQVPQAAGLRAQAAGQLKVTDVDRAVRGSVTDRNSSKLAFTTEARALTFQPTKIRKQLAEAKQKSPKAPDPDQRLMEIAKDISG